MADLAFLDEAVEEAVQPVDDFDPNTHDWDNEEVDLAPPEGYYVAAVREDISWVRTRTGRLGLCVPVTVIQPTEYAGIVGKGFTTYAFPRQQNNVRVVLGLKTLAIPKAQRNGDDARTGTIPGTKGKHIGIRVFQNNKGYMNTAVFRPPTMSPPVGPSPSTKTKTTDESF